MSSCPLCGSGERICDCPRTKPANDRPECTCEHGKRGYVCASCQRFLADVTEPKPAPQAEAPRGWTLHGAKYSPIFKCGLYNIHGPMLGDEVVDVIEKSAYDRVCRERDELLENESKMDGALSAKQEIIYGLQRELEEAKAEHAAALKAGANIGLLLKEERDAARAEAERLQDTPGGKRMYKLMNDYDTLLTDARKLRSLLSEIQIIRTWDLSESDYAAVDARVSATIESTLKEFDTVYGSSTDEK